MDTSSKWSPKFYTLATLSLLAGLILTFVSWMQICTETCSEAHNYVFYGTKFEIFGGIYFLILNFLHLLSKKHQKLSFFVALLISSGLGAEAMFIWLQKTEIGHYCTVCLSIAATLLLAGIFYFLMFYIKQREGGFMKSFSLLSVFAIGFMVAFIGVVKIDPLEAAQQEIKDQIRFGKKDSPVEVYLFTDWTCPACRTLESKIESLVTRVSKKASFTFVDLVIHPETLNYAPYNLGLMMNYKPYYFKARDALNHLSAKTKKPTDKQVHEVFKPIGFKFKELSYEDISLGMKYFEQLADTFKVEATPTLVIVNRDTKKGQKLAGAEQINEDNTIKIIEALK